MAVVIHFDGLSHNNSIQGMKMQRKIGAEKYVECSARRQETLNHLFKEATLTVLSPSTGRGKPAPVCGHASLCKIL